MVNRNTKILIVDDDRSLSEILINILTYDGYECDVAHDGKTGFKKLKDDTYDLMLLDLKLPDMSGMQILQQVKKTNSHLQVIMISGQGTIHTAVEATKEGAFDFLEKPLDSERISVTVKNALEKGKLERNQATLFQKMKDRYRMIGNSEPMKRVEELIMKAAGTNSKVLIEGENGTGKELVARSIHLNSLRAFESFVAINCAAIPETLIESELFGYKKGAFTGAVMDKPGRFQLADGGVLFMDEIGDMSLMTQAKVLRVLEEEVVELVGGSHPQSVDTRVIAATNKDLHQAMKEGGFREDLYFRLNVLNIKVPPLRQRSDDIPLLIDHFLNGFCEEHNVKKKVLAPRALNLIMTHTWPGNVRELRNFVEKLVILVNAVEIQPSDVSSILNINMSPKTEIHNNLSLKEARLIFERDYIREKLVANNWNVTKAAQVLDIPRTYLHKKIKSLNVEM